VTFVDTPVLGSVTPGGALQTYAYLPRCDHATFLFEATAPVGEEDLTVLAFLHEAGITTSVLLSKADLLYEQSVQAWSTGSTLLSAVVPWDGGARRHDLGSRSCQSDTCRCSYGG
jgi:predicted GTPase